MSTGRSHHHHDAHEAVATLVRSVPVRLVEVSRSGCRLECASRIESGTSGQLAVELAGLAADRRHPGRALPAAHGSGRGLPGGRRTAQNAKARPAHGAHGHQEDHQRGAGRWPRPVSTTEMPVLADVRTGEASGRSESRAPPAQPGQGALERPCWRQLRGVRPGKH